MVLNGSGAADQYEARTLSLLDIVKIDLILDCHQACFRVLHTLLKRIMRKHSNICIELANALFGKPPHLAQL